MVQFTPKMIDDHDLFLISKILQVRAQQSPAVTSNLSPRALLQLVRISGTAFGVAAPRATQMILRSHRQLQASSKVSGLATNIFLKIDISRPQPQRLGGLSTTSHQAIGTLLGTSHGTAYGLAP